jgi:hypothetical protein
MPLNITRRPSAHPNKGSSAIFLDKKRDETKEMMSDRHDGMGLQISTRKAYYTLSTSPAWKEKKSQKPISEVVV